MYIKGSNELYAVDDMTVGWFKVFFDLYSEGVGSDGVVNIRRGLSPAVDFIDVKAQIKDLLDIFYLYKNKTPPDLKQVVDVIWTSS